jgi:O-6-methylguanine DNA methyltransferase
MTEQTPTWRETVAGVRTLRTRAPATLVPDVLAEVGIADGYASLPSPIGEVLVAFRRGPDGSDLVTMLSPAGDAAVFEHEHLARTGRPVRPVREAPAAVRRSVHAGRPVGIGFDLARQSPFERDVLRKAGEIPSGEVRSYAWVAREIGRPAAVRAVGSALGRNPVPLLIPCHRVVRSDGRIGQYAFGSPVKRAVLSAEGVDPDELELLARKAVRYIGSDTTNVFCLPTCHAARRIQPRHQVRFATATAAAAAGYRPCKRCRPVAAVVIA